MNNRGTDMATKAYAAASGNIDFNRLFVEFRIFRRQPKYRDTVIRRWRDDGRKKKILRYLAGAEPEKIRQQLPLEQVPMKGAP
ncbi:MAG TPA: hypothetical protein VF427_00665 [Noviherbaspirillum sp.]